jgi:hypothetical protein
MSRGVLQPRDLLVCITTRGSVDAPDVWAGDIAQSWAEG